MKKLGKFLLVGAMAGIACIGLVGCGGPKDYTGEYSYESAHEGQSYGVKVTVTVDGDTIKEVKCADDTEAFFNITAQETWGGHDTTAAALPDYLKKFEGKKVSDIKAIKVDTVAQTEGWSLKGQPTAISDENYVITGATQTSGRIILAIQNALKDVK